MRRHILIILTIPILCISAPLIEISHPKANFLLSSLKKNFPTKKLNIVIYPNFSLNFVSLNGKALPKIRDEKKLAATLDKELKTVLKQNEKSKISLDSVKISQQDDAFTFSFAPCNYTVKEFLGKWVAFLTGENSVLLLKKEGQISMPAGTCHKPIELKWKSNRKPKELILIVALYDDKGNYVISKSNKEKEVEKR
jgi:hypothetical protein